MGNNWSRTQRKRHKEETLTDSKPHIRECFLSEKQKAKREAKRRKVAVRLMGKKGRE